MRLTSIDALVVWLSGVIEAMDPCNNDRAQGLVDGFKTVLEVIESAEPIEAEPVKHGKWEEHSKDSFAMASHAEKLRCSICAHFYYQSYGDGALYCPNCGAKMDLEE